MMAFGAPSQLGRPWSIGDAFIWSGFKSGPREDAAAEPRAQKAHLPDMAPDLLCAGPPRGHERRRFGDPANAGLTAIDDNRRLVLTWLRMLLRHIAAASRQIREQRPALRATPTVLS